MKEYYKNGDCCWEVKTYPIITEDSGRLGVVELGVDMDFEVKRSFFLTNIKGNVSRGHHSHLELNQLIICLNGTFEIVLDNGIKQEKIKMKADDKCLYVEGRVWRHMESFSENSVMLVLCDREYRYDTVVRSYDEFISNLDELNK